MSRYFLLISFFFFSYIYSESLESSTSSNKTLQFYQASIATQKTKETIADAGKEAITAIGSKSALFVSMGNAYSQIKENVLAIESFHQAIQLNPKSPSIHNRLGLALSTIAFYRQAESAYKAAIAFATTESAKITYYMNLIKTLEKLEETEDVKSSLEQVLKIDPAYAPAISMKNALQS